LRTQMKEQASKHQEVLDEKEHQVSELEKDCFNMKDQMQKALKIHSANE